MSESEEKYDLKESAQGIGQLYPVLVDKKGRVIDGFHRIQADPTWRVQPLDNIDTDEKLLVARCVANWHRRPVGREEKAEWINGLAEIYKKQGLKLSGISGRRFKKNEIMDKLVEVLGLAEKTIGTYLSDKFKQEYPEETRESQQPRVSASERVESRLGPEVAERFRKEVLEEAKLSPEELAEKRKKTEELKVERKRKIAENKRLKDAELEKKAIKKIVKRQHEEVKAELLENPNFRLEAIQKDRAETVKKLTEERGVPQIWDIKRVNEAQDVMDEFIKVHEKVQGWGVNQYMILMKASRLVEAHELTGKIQSKIQEWRTTKYV